MNLLSIILTAVLAIAFAGVIVLALWGFRQMNSPLARGAIVRERIRREVQEEFEQRFRQTCGVRRLLVVLRREAEISRRAGRVIHGR